MSGSRGTAPARLHGSEVVDMLRHGGEVGEALAAVDWTATPLGPPETWPRPLPTLVQALLSSRFSMWMAWGPELTFFCNDAYRRDTLGRKYPWALGKPARRAGRRSGGASVRGSPRGWATARRPGASR